MFYVSTIKALPRGQIWHQHKVIAVPAGMRGSVGAQYAKSTVRALPSVEEWGDVGQVLIGLWLASLIRSLFYHRDATLRLALTPTFGVAVVQHQPDGSSSGYTWRTMRRQLPIGKYTAHTLPTTCARGIRPTSGSRESFE